MTIGQKKPTKYNTLLNFPHLVEEFHPTKNLIDIKDLSKGSHVKVWWICSKSHEWQTIPLNRTKKHRSTGCPICAGKLPSIGRQELLNCQLEVLKNRNESIEIYEKIDLSGMWKRGK